MIYLDPGYTCKARWREIHKLTPWISQVAMTGSCMTPLGLGLPMRLMLRSSRMIQWCLRPQAHCLTNNIIQLYYPTYYVEPNL